MKARTYFQQRVEDQVQHDHLRSMSQYIHLTIQLGEGHRRERRIGYKQLNLLELTNTNPAIKIKNIFEEHKSDCRKPKRVLIKGRAGMGKSTLMRKIVYDWCSDSFWQNKFKYIFCFEFRHLNSILHVNNFDCYSFLFQRQGPNLVPSERDVLLEHIDSNPGEVLLIMDGLDEFQALGKIIQANPPINQNDTKLSLPMTLYNIIRGNLLQGIYILVTSRPRAGGLKYLGEGFQRTIEICGFGSKDVMTYVDKFCGSETELATTMKNYLSHNMNILSFCHIPLVCYFVCTCLEQILKTDQSTLEDWQINPQSNTQLFCLIFTFILYDRHPDFKINPPKKHLDVWSILKTSVQKLMAIASLGFKSTPVQIVFSASDIEEMCKVSLSDNSLAVTAVRLLRK